MTQEPASPMKDLLALESIDLNGNNLQPGSTTDINNYAGERNIDLLGAKINNITISSSQDCPNSSTKRRIMFNLDNQNGANDENSYDILMQSVEMTDVFQNRPKPDTSSTSTAKFKRSLSPKRTPGVKELSKVPVASSLKKISPRASNIVMHDWTNAGFVFAYMKQVRINAEPMSLYFDKMEDHVPKMKRAKKKKVDRPPRRSARIALRNKLAFSTGTLSSEIASLQLNDPSTVSARNTSDSSDDSFC